MKFTGILIQFLVCMWFIHVAKAYFRRAQQFQVISLGPLKHQSIAGKHNKISKPTRVNVDQGLSSADKSDNGERGKNRFSKGDRKKEGKKIQVPYTPPSILEKLMKVNSISDFIRIFNVKGVQVSYPKAIGELSDCANCEENPGYERYTLTTTEQNQVVTREIKDEDTGCRLRDAIHFFNVPVNAQFQYFPSCALVKRCDGCCKSQRQKKCEADKTCVEKRAVFMLFDNATVTNTTVDVEHHSTCKCGCMYNQSYCLPTQSFDPHLCQCGCKKKACSSGKEWSSRKCSCICSNEQPCGTNRVWDETYCQCACITSDCPSGMFRDRNTCACRK